MTVTIEKNKSDFYDCLETLKNHGYKIEPTASYYIIHNNSFWNRGIVGGVDIISGKITILMLYEISPDKITKLAEIFKDKPYDVVIK